MMLAQQLRKFLIAAPAWMPEVMQRSMSSTVCGPSEEIIKSLKTVLTDRAPVTYGTCVIPPKDFGLFYGTASGCTARHISLLNTQAEQVELLARACHAAHFGLNKRDGYEAAFHTAEKLTLDVDHFAAKFDVQRCGILARVKNDLLGRHNITKSMECELYKLNVFREGDSWRTYNGTPGSAKMFGSLVIVFPIPHTGGKFILRHGGKEWSFETGKELAATARPSVGYVAFRNDVEHVMGPVLSGHRVTLTYNLYFGNRYNTAQTGLPKSKSIRQQEKEFKKGMEQLLADPLFLPHGGCIGFGLQHEYPLSASTVAASFAGRLKGSDAVIERVCKQLGIPIEPKIFTRTWDINRKDRDRYPDPEMEVLTDRVMDFSGQQEVQEDEMVKMFIGDGALFLPHLRADDRRPCATIYDKEIDDHVPVPTTDIHWITEVTQHNTVKTEYVAYGNQAGLDHLYGTICLIAFVGPPGNR